MKCPECRKNMKRVEENLYRCPSCGVEGKMDKPEFCPECGYSLTEELTHCPICGAELPELVFKIIEKEEEIPEDYGQEYQEDYSDPYENYGTETVSVDEDDVYNNNDVIIGGTATSNVNGYKENTEENGRSTSYNDIYNNSKVGSSSRKSGAGKKRSGKNSSAKALIAVAVLAVGIPGAFILKKMVLDKKDVGYVNLNSYLDVEFSGVDGSGTVDASFDLQAMIDENPDEFEISKKARESVARMMHESDADSLSDADVYLYLFGDLFDNGPVSVVFDPSNDLSNGDAVSVYWNCPEETLEDLFPIDVVFENRTYKVKGLEQADVPATTPEPTQEPTKAPTKAPTKEPTKTPTKVPTKEPTKAPTKAPTDTISVINGIRADKSDFMFPNSSTEYLSYSDLDYLRNSEKKEKELYTQTMINEIFARYGYTFTSNSDSANLIRNKIGNKDWYIQAQSYCPVAPGDQQTLMENYMNAIEKANIKLINQWQQDNIPQ